MFFKLNQFIRRECSAGLLLLVPLVAFAQKNTPPPDSVTLKTVVIQATRASAKSPVPHTNFTAEQIKQAYQAQDVPYLLSSVPGLVESSDAGTGIGYTGMRIRGSDPTRINVTINGIPLNDAESQGMFWVDLPDLAASAAEIQVQRGVGSSTNGAGAFGATVNLDLSQVKAEPFAQVSNSFGSFNTRKHSAYLGTGLLGGKIAFTGRLSQIHSEGFVDRASADLRSYHVSGAYLDDRQSIQVHLLSGHEVTYQAWNGLPAQFLNVDSLRRFNTAGTEKPGTPHPNEVDNYTQSHYFFHYKRLLPKGLSLQWNGHYTRGAGYYEQYKADESFPAYALPNPSIGDSTLSETDLIRRRWLDNHFYGSSLALHWALPLNPPQLSAAPVFLIGGAYTNYVGRHFGEVIWADYAIPHQHRYYDNDASKQDANIFGKIELHFRRGVSVFLDMQYRQVRYNFLGFDNNLNNVTQTATLNFFNPKAGLNWQIRENWTAYAFFGIGQREPNRDDYTQSTPASRPRAERLFDWEGGIKHTSERLKTSANLYWMRYRDQLVIDGRINDVGAYIRTNIPQSYRAGIEVEANWQVLAGLSLSGNIVFSKNKVQAFTEYRDNWDTGEQETVQFRNTNLAFSPDIISRAEIQWAIWAVPDRYRLSTSLTGKYVGKQYLDNTSNETTVLPAYFFSDFRINLDLEHWKTCRLNLIFAINNVLDARYVANGWVYRYVSAGFDDRPYNTYTRLEGNGVYHQAGYFPQAGRNAMATLVVHF